jgi:hypothetical protein
VGAYRLKLLKLIYALLLSMPFLGCSCCDLGCGPGEYTGSIIETTEPRVHPIRFDNHEDFTLFVNGELTFRDWRAREIIVYPLGDICNSDSILDMAFYDDALVERNFSWNAYELQPAEEDQFYLALTPSKCCKLDSDFNLIAQFGNAGNGDSLLLNAISVDVNYRGNIYIVDASDGSLKAFDSEGAFLFKQSHLGLPSLIKDQDFYLFILDESTDTIRKYDYDGNYIATVLDTPFLDNIVSFSFGYENQAWVIDRDGLRVCLYDLDGMISEVKYDCCIDEKIYNFGKIVDITADFGLFAVVDYEYSRVVFFSEKLCNL